MASFPSREGLSNGEAASDDELSAFPTEQDYSATGEASIRPGVVYILDKGTSGLLVVLKDEHSHAHLAEKFKNHNIRQVYVALTCGMPTPASGHIDIPIGRDPNNILRMAAGYGLSKNGKTRHAASRYKVVEILAGGGSALVEWRLETGRTHQIRAHAKYLGIPLLGDEVYGGTKSMALSLLQHRSPSEFHGKLLEVVSRLERPFLHALTLGFTHPKTRESVHFTQLPPADFAEILTELRNINTEKYDATDMIEEAHTVEQRYRKALAGSSHFYTMVGGSRTFKLPQMPTNHHHHPKVASQEKMLSVLLSDALVHWLLYLCHLFPSLEPSIQNTSPLKRSDLQQMHPTKSRTIHWRDLGD